MEGQGARWDSAQYLRFEDERTRPVRDLVSRIELTSPGHIVDLGCGPGNSTAVLRNRWPDSQILGVDSSKEMLARARSSSVRADWIGADVATWEPGRVFDLVFSNAFLHWLPSHQTELPRLWGWVAAEGALAFQVPVRGEPAPVWLRVLRNVRNRDRWRHITASDASEANVLTPESYYDVLSSVSSRVELWDTEYQHVLSGPREVVEWIQGTALRPVLEQLPAVEERSAFLGELALEMDRAYPRRADGRILFPFRRRFGVAYKAAGSSRPERIT